MAEKKKQKGYIKLDRSILDHWLWSRKPFGMGQAWIDLILLANHKDVKRYRDGKVKTFQRGTITTSYDTLAERWGWDRKKVMRFISVLISDGMVSKNGTTHGTTVSLVNYDKFQGGGTTDGTTDGLPMGLPMDYRWTADGTQTRMNNNDNNDKNEKNERGQSPALVSSSPPSIDEVKLYAQLTGAVSDPETFFRYYDERGWKRTRGLPIDNWRKTFDTWEAREKKERAEQGDRGDRGRGSGSGTSRPARPNSFTNFEQRNVDYGALEDALVRKGMGIESEEDKALIARFTS